MTCQYNLQKICMIPAILLCSNSRLKPDMLCGSACSPVVRAAREQLASPCMQLNTKVVSNNKKTDKLILDTHSRHIAFIKKHSIRDESRENYTHNSRTLKLANLTL